jgi:hypothetical protein
MDRVHLRVELSRSEVVFMLCGCVATRNERKCHGKTPRGKNYLHLKQIEDGAKRLEMCSERPFDDLRE